MPKQSGLGDNLYVGGYNLSGDINSLSNILGNQATIDVTGIDKYAFERIGGIRDGSMEFVSYFNKTAGQAHPVLAALPQSDVVVSYFRGTGIGNSAASCVGKQLNYDGDRTQAGDFTFKTTVQANGYGLEWGQQLTPGPRTDTAATNGASLDTLQPLAFGLQAYLHVFAFTGTSATVTIQDSADNATFANVAGATFTAVTGITAQRIAVTGNVRRYLRVASTGTFTNLRMAVNLVKNDTAVTF